MLCVEHQGTKTISLGDTTNRFRLLLSAALLPVLLFAIFNEVHNVISPRLLKVESNHRTISRFNITSYSSDSNSSLANHSSHTRKANQSTHAVKFRKRASVRGGENVILSKRDESLHKKESTTKNNKAKLLWDVGREGNVSFTQIAAALPDVNMNDPDIAAVYSLKALSRLETVKAKIKRGERITLVVNGGSSSAGAPGIPYEDRYFTQLANRMAEETVNANISVVDRSHGARNTVHSAHLMPSLMPEKVDILIWEFAINDGNKEADTRNQLILWLRNVEAHLNPPPLVVLVYLWKSPFQQTNKGDILCRTFDQHKRIAAEYDFVLGHINMAAYMTSLHWDFETVKSTFLADVHHPNALFHHVLAKNLWQLLVAHKPPIREKIVPQQNRTDVEWICGKSSASQRKIFNIFEDTKGIARGSYTADLPQNPANTTRPGMLVPSGPMKMMRFGKAVNLRYDRQLGIILPCCDSSDIVEFDVSSYGHIHALMLTLRCQAERRHDIQLVIDGVKMNDTELIRPSSHGCLLGGYNMNIGDLPSLDVDLVPILRKAKTIGFCDRSCKTSKKSLPMVSMSIL